MNPYWSAVVARLEPYVPGEQPEGGDLVKLNTNENSYPPSPRVLAALADAARELRRYPDPEAAALKRAVAKHARLDDNNVFVGNGSDEVLAHAFRALLDHDAPVLFPDVTYGFYPVWCGLFGIDYETVAVDQDFRVRVDDYLRPNGGIVFPNPNAPTGVALGLDDVERLLCANRETVVVVDEAYVDFGAESAVPLIGDYPNLLIVQTLSKSRALAGLRVGFALGDRGLVHALERVKNSFNSYPLSRLAQAGAVAALEDRGYFEAMRRRVIDDRERLAAGLRRLGFEVLPSAAHFVFARHPNKSGAEIHAALREDSIVVRHFRAPRIEDYLRITAAADEERERLLHSLARLLGDDRTPPA